MKAAFLGLFALAGTGVFAQETATPRMVEVKAQFVRATDEQMRQMAADTPLSMVFSYPISSAPGGADETRLLSVQGILTAEEAGKFLVKLKTAGVDLIGDLRAITLSGHRATLENVRELRYPAEFSDPARESGKVIPSAFELKNVGVTLEVMPTVGPDGVTINLTASPRIVDFLGFIDYSGVKPGDAPPKPESYPAMLKAPLKGGGVWQPVFSSREVSTTVALYSGQTLLIAETGEGPRCFIFLTATVIPEQ